MVTVNLEEANALQGQLRAWAYNALDCTGTLEVFETLKPRLRPAMARTYAFERACQAPALAMMRRGVRIDTVARSGSIDSLKKSLKRKEKEIDKLPLIQKIWDGQELETGKCPNNPGKRHKWPRGVPDKDRSCELCHTKRIKRSPFNANSSKQCIHLFYELLGLPVHRNKDKKVSTNEDVLRRIRKKYTKYSDLTDHILETRGIIKQIGFLNSRLTADNRFPSSFNVGTAWTGRWSSSKNPFKLGNNLQNIAPKHRSMFIPDAGYELCYADLQQAESMVVAYVSGDKDYIEAHETGNVHVNAARIYWPDLDWNGEDAHDLNLANNTRCHWKTEGSYYDQSKRNQHGINYGLTPFGLSLQAKMPLDEAKLAYKRHFENFPFIKVYHEKIAEKVKNVETLVNPLGRECKLFGRPWDTHTLNQGYSFIPQSSVADIINIAIWRLWRSSDPHLVQILGQIHDAILCQYKKEDRERAHKAIRSAMRVPVEIGDYIMVIGVDVEIGMNWGKAEPLNPNGMRKAM